MAGVDLTFSLRLPHMVVYLAAAVVYLVEYLTAAVVYAAVHLTLRWYTVGFDRAVATGRESGVRPHDKATLPIQG